MPLMLAQDHVGAMYVVWRRGLRFTFGCDSVECQARLARSEVDHMPAMYCAPGSRKSATMCARPLSAGSVSVWSVRWREE